MTEDDPFEGFEAPDDGDPFEELSGPDEPPDSGSDSDSEAAKQLPEDPFEHRREENQEASFGPDAGDGSEADPFASFSDAAAGTDDPFEAFEDVGVDGYDPDAVWEELTTAEEADVVDDQKEYAEVSKHRFCERCEHFSEPPAVRCDHEGTAIVEFLDMETVKLVNCPVVARQRELEERGTDF